MVMQWIKQQIWKRLVASAGPSELNAIVFAVLKRYHQLNADEEVVFLSLPRHDKEERERIIRAILSLEQHHP